ncbi:hypothetical protein DFJ77DRAFT_106956 [Powellomyces hirtus]|nr:hypothetical protein DFJ77DRAFT_106956 [Powellomyces hirtus]
MVCWFCARPLHDDSTDWFSNYPFPATAQHIWEFEKRAEVGNFEDPDLAWFQASVVVFSDAVSPPGISMTARAWSPKSPLKCNFDLEAMAGYPRVAPCTEEADEGNSRILKVEDDTDEAFSAYYRTPKKSKSAAFQVRYGRQLNLHQGATSDEMGGVHWPAHYGCLLLAAAWTGHLDKPFQLFQRSNWSPLQSLHLRTQRVVATLCVEELEGFDADRKNNPTLLPTAIHYGDSCLNADTVYNPVKETSAKEWEARTGDNSLYTKRYAYVQGQGHPRDRYDYYYYKKPTQYVLRRPDIFPVPHGIGDAEDRVAGHKLMPFLDNPTKSRGMGPLGILSNDILSLIFRILIPSPEGFSRLMATNRAWYTFFASGNSPAGAVNTHPSLWRLRCEYLGVVPTATDLKKRAIEVKEMMQVGMDWRRYYLDCAREDSMRNRARIRRCVRRIDELLDSVDESYDVEFEGDIGDGVDVENDDSGTSDSEDLDDDGDEDGDDDDDIEVDDSDCDDEENDGDDR